jgi:tetratricopeptide (TPR) repeat protein
MRGLLLAVGVLILLEACTASSPRRSAISDEELLSGKALDASFTVSTPVVSIDDAFALDDEMQEFVRQVRDYGGDSSAKVIHLLQAMKQRGLFSLEYNEALTHTVSGTFHERRGNCLSFTMLFIALARETGLHARYQLVDVPPQWNLDSDLVVIANHVNAVIDSKTDHDLVVDFNKANFHGDFVTHRIDDAYAAALFYTNLGAEAMLRRDYPESFTLLREAVHARSDVAPPWVNLGVLYGRQGLYEYAEAAYLRALQVAPQERSALANLAGIYEALGDPQLAAQYRERVRRYQDMNPYYHYARAQKAYHEQQYEDTLAELRRAIRLRNDESVFYALQGQALKALGREGDASKSFARATESQRQESLEGARPIQSSSPGRLSHPAYATGNAVFQAPKSDVLVQLPADGN